MKYCEKESIETRAMYVNLVEDFRPDTPQYIKGIFKMACAYDEIERCSLFDHVTINIKKIVFDREYIFVVVLLWCSG